LNSPGQEGQLSEHDPAIGQSTGEAAPVDSPAVTQPTLVDDVKALVEDGKTYLEAELQFQKSRAALAVDRGRSGAIYGVAAAAVLHLALIALVVGAIFALAPLITAWGATAVVVGLLLIAAVLLGLAAKRRFARLTSAIREAGQ
jgi:Flp pilus assembly protein TadB